MNVSLLTVILRPKRFEFISEELDLILKQNLNSRGKRRINSKWLITSEIMLIPYIQRRSLQAPCIEKVSASFADHVRMFIRDAISAIKSLSYSHEIRHTNSLRRFAEKARVS